MHAVQHDDCSAPPPARRICGAGVVFLLVLLIGLALSAIAAYVLEQNRRLQVEEHFQRLASERISRIDNQFETSQQQAEILSRHLRLAGDLGAEAFASVTEPLLGDSLAFLWMPRVTLDRRSAFEAALQARTGAPGLRELDAQGETRSAGERAEYFPIAYINSRGLGENLLGLDLATDPGRRSLLLRARERAGLTAAVLNLLSITSYGQALIVMAPVLREGELLGFVSSALLLDDVLALQDDPEGLHTELWDLSEAGQPVLLHSTRETGEVGALEHRRVLPLGDRLYAVSLKPLSGFTHPHGGPVDLWVFLLGGLASLLAACLFASLLGERRRTRRLVARRTAELRASQEELQASQEELQTSERRWHFALEGAGDGVWDWDCQTGKAYFSPTWKRMLGYRDEEIEGCYEQWLGLIHPQDQAAALAALDRHMRGETEAVNYEYRLRRKDGGWKWILSRGQVVLRDAQALPLRMIGVHTDIDGRKHTELQLNRTLAELDALLRATTHVSIIATDLQGTIQRFNVGAERMLGYRAEQMLGQPVERLYLAEELERRAAQSGQALGPACMTADCRTSQEWTYVRSDGGQLVVDLITTSIRDASEQPVGYLGIATDATERRRSRAALEERDQLLQKLTQRVPGIIFQLHRAADGHFSVPYVSTALAGLYELDPAEVRADAQLVFRYVHPEDYPRLRDGLQHSAEHLSMWQTELRCLLPVQGQRWFRCEAMPEPAADGGVVWHGFLSDITPLKDTEQALRLLSETDSLTGVFNRRYFQERLDLAIAQAGRREIGLALLMFDIDHFKQINDQFGHATGDRVLQVCCQRLGARLRHSDLLCRLGGEEFAVLCSQTNLAQAATLAEVLRALLAGEPIGDAGRVTASFGVAEWRAGETADDLLSRADAALYTAKRAGRDRVRLAPC